MIITIIGSLSKFKEMEEAKEYFERFGHKVNCPTSPELQEMALIEIQKEWIKKIKEADLIVAVPKAVYLAEKSGQTQFVHEFGESTSYEMAIASELNKEIIFS